MTPRRRRPPADPLAVLLIDDEVLPPIDDQAGEYQDRGDLQQSERIAGAVALLWSANPSLVGQVDETAAILRASALNRPDASCGAAPGGDPNNVYGDGRLDVYAALAASAPPKPFRRATDCRNDGRFDLTDPITLLGSLFLGEAAPDCRDACDFEDNGRLDITDPIGMLQRLFLGGAPPSAPYPGCGTDPLGDGLLCQVGSCG